MLGPIMIGPSSSHTAGVVNIARVGVKILGDIPDAANIIFYNSFAQTYEGHGSDKAIIAGLLDYSTDDIRIKTSFEHAKERGLQYSFKSVKNASTLHPNTIKLMLKKDKNEIEMIGESRGGGVIRISEVNGFHASFTANNYIILLFADDKPGSISFVTNIISHDACNIATMTVSRKGKNNLACQILEMDSGLNDITLTYLRNLSFVHKLIYIPKIN